MRKSRYAMKILFNETSRSSCQQPKMELRRLEDIHFDKFVVSVDQIEYGNVLAITYDDSSINFYDPKTMAVFSGSDDNTTVTCLAQAGFHSPPEIPGMEMNSKLYMCPG